VRGEREAVAVALADPGGQRRPAPHRDVERVEVQPLGQLLGGGPGRIAAEGLEQAAAQPDGDGPVAGVAGGVGQQRPALLLEGRSSGRRERLGHGFSSDSGPAGAGRRRASSGRPEEADQFQICIRPLQDLY